jgi:N-acetylglucosaminyl-diphospho-decaprenol L-rhamnosyltransferase
VQYDSTGRTLPTLRRAPSVRGVWAEALLGGKAAGNLGLGELITWPRTYLRQAEAAWATGSALLVSRACREAVGPWDESFFLYSEETDFALRAADLGFRLVLAPGAVVTHYQGESHSSAQLWTMLTLNRLRLYARRHGALRRMAFWAGLLVGEALRAGAGRTTSRHATAALWEQRPGRAADDAAPAGAA